MKKIVLLFFVFLCTAYAFGQDKDFKPEVTIGGLVFTGYQFNIDNADFIQKLDMTTPNASAPFGYNPIANQFETGRNSFYMDRAYININAKLSKQVSARLTPDIYSTQDFNNKAQWSYQVKFAYVDYTPLNEDNGMSLGFQLGVIPNNWVGFAERNNTFRFVQKTFTDYTWTSSAKYDLVTNSVVRTTGSFFATADVGLTARFTFPQKFADLYISLINGNGFRDLSFDQTRLKDVNINGFIYPLANYIKVKKDIAKQSGKSRINGISEFNVGGYAYLGSYSNMNNYYSNNRFGALVAARFNFDNFGYFRVGGEYGTRVQSVPSLTDSTVNSGGFSTWFEFNPPVEELNEKLLFYFRFDMFDPNSNKPGINTPGLTADNGKQNLMIIGLFFKPANILTFGFSYQKLGFEKDFVVKYDGTVKSSIDRFFFNTLLNF